jgi:hypothetical protein
MQREGGGRGGEREREGERGGREFCRLWRSYSSGYEDVYLLAYNNMYKQQIPRF